MAQLQKFQALVAGSTSGSHTTKAGACLMVIVLYQFTSRTFSPDVPTQVIVLCFAVFLGGWAPTKYSYWTTPSHDYATTTGQSQQSPVCRKN